MKNKKISPTNIIVGIAAIIGVIATFLPWVSTSLFGITVSAKGTDGNGWISLIAFAAVLGFVIYDVLKGIKWAKIAITVASAVALLIVIINLTDITEGISLGVGLILALVAGLVTAIMPWIPIKKKK